MTVLLAVDFAVVLQDVVVASVVVFFVDELGFGVDVDAVASVVRHRQGDALRELVDK